LLDEQEIVDSVEAARAPGTFNIVEVLQGRGYPQSVVDVYLDESAMYDMAVAKEELEKLDLEVGRKTETEANKAKREDILSNIESISKRILASKYSIHLMGISEGKREDYYRQALKKYPREYQTGNALSGLMGGEPNRVEKESPERDALFTDYLWQGCISKIVSPEGDEQSEFAYSTIRSMRETFPLNAIVKINEGIDKLRAATALFSMGTGEDFLAKP
jgi:hypothetical protein